MWRRVNTAGEVNDLGREVDGAKRGGLFWTSELRQLRERIDLEKEVVFLSLGELMVLEWLLL